MELPAAVGAHFEADQHKDEAALAAAFAKNATVGDEDAEHRGSVAIRDRWRTAKYRHSAQPLEATQADGRTVVRARVTGEFPGSPATLTLRFTLADDRIARLQIG
jgi:hypothetical protein